MKLTSKNITIRLLEEKDMLYIQKLWADETTMLATGGAFRIKDEAIHTMYKILRKDDASVNNHFIIEAAGESIGDLSIRKFSESDKMALLDLKIEHTKRNKGYAKETLKLYLDYFFNEVKGEAVYIEFWLENYFAQDKLKDYGFEAEAVSHDLHHLKLNKKRYFDNLQNGGKNEL